MSTLAGSLRIVAFGSAQSIWGAAWYGDRGQLLLGHQDGGEVVSDFISEGDAADEDWGLSGPELSLTLSGVGEAAAEPELGRFDQLCRVRGEATINGAKHPVDELGRRCVREPLLQERLESIRDFSAWFELDGERTGAALTALRPADARGHERDVVAAALFTGGGASVVAEPRLSTTYTADGSPSRAGMELWLADQDDAENLYPRRVTGVASGPMLSSSAGDVALQARPFSCVSQGQQGSGVYLLASNR